MGIDIKIVAMYIIPFLAALVPILIGQFYGIYHSRKPKFIKEAPIGSLVGAAFGLLAFMLAFAFQIASNRYDRRKELLLDEVTNIRTTYLRAGLIPEPYRSGTKKLMIEYVNLRISVYDTAKRAFAIARSQQILDSCWNYTEILAAQDRSSEIYSLYTTSINDLVNNFNHRITVALEYRMPPWVLWSLGVITFLSMLILGYQFGISGRSYLWLNLLLAAIFAVVLFLILILEHPETGLTKLNLKPVYRLQQQLNEMQQAHP